MDDLDTTVVDIHSHMVPARCTLAARKGEAWHGVRMGLNDNGAMTWEAEGSRWTLAWENRDTGWDGRLKKMDEIGVDVQVLSVSPALYWYRTLEADRAVGMAEETNDAIAAAVEEHPTRFRGLAHLPLQDPAASVKELERAVGLGLAGVAIPGNVAGKDWDSPDLFPVLEAAAALDVMVFVHPATDVRFPPVDPESSTQVGGRRYFLLNIVGLPLETTMALATMIFGGVFDRLPDLRVCLAHGGGFGCAALGRFDHAHVVRPECKDIAKNPTEYGKDVWWDSLTHSHKKLRFLLDEVGVSQVVLGTDYPADMGQPEPVRWVRAATDLTPDEHRAVLGENVRALLGAHAPQPTGDLR